MLLMPSIVWLYGSTVRYQYKNHQDCTTNVLRQDGTTNGSVWIEVSWPAPILLEFEESC